MRLRAIELTNVRRFAGQTARLRGIGDGITVLSEPNEFGKSTFFDALHAAFFERHTSRNAAIKALQPHAGGSPEVVVEVELPEGRFRIAKRWLGRAQAKVTDASGRLIAQADEAEAWIDRLMGEGLAGPSGLLWVRQGLMGMEPEGGGTDEKRERERGLAARRDLLSSVAGEIDMMTGGRRMDAVLDRVAEALSRLATATMKPKAGGLWADAVDEAAALAAEEEVLRPKAARLSSDLARRAEVQRNLAARSDPAGVAARAATLQQAEAAHAAALDHQSKVEKAATALRLAQMDAEKAQLDLGRARALSDQVDRARADLTRAEEAATAARDRAEDLAARDRQALERAETLAVRVRDLRQRLQRATRAKAARQAAGEAGDLQRRLDRAAALQATLDQTQARRATIRVTARLPEAAEKAQGGLDLARARAEAQAVTIEVHPDGAQGAMIDGRPLPAGPVPVMAAAEILLPGFGRLRIDPGADRGSGAAAIAQAERALSDLLAEAGAATLDAARARWAEAQALDAAAREAAAILAEVAPDGPVPLQKALAAARAAAEEQIEETADPVALTAELAAAEAEEQTATASARAVHGLAVTAGEARAAAEANRNGAERQLAAALTEAGDPAGLAARIAALAAGAADLAAGVARADSALSLLRADAPDLVTAEARLTRARAAVEQARIANQQDELTLASLNATILALAEEGIEERLSALAGERAEAEARASRYAAEVRALVRLKGALEDARTKARDAYFGPVLQELQPLLAILHPGARLTIDDRNLLPATLTRNGQEEALEILSGGTREQVAILTRLAFARLFAMNGRPVPVILDDALVHSDDDRIEAMFDALHRTARDQQILVLTCRQRAFAALGGERAVVEVAAT